MKKTLLIASITVFLLLSGIFNVKGQNTVSIGGFTASSSSVPIDCNWYNTISQFIYTADEIGEQCYIHSISFYHGDHPELGGGCTPVDRNIKVYFTIDYQEDFDDTWDWVRVSDNHLVANTVVTMPDGDAMVTIPLDAPYPYRHDGNLVITIVDNSTSWEQQHYFAGDNGSVIRSISKSRDSEPFSINNFPGDPIFSTFRPRITLATSELLMVGIDEGELPWLTSYHCPLDVTAIGDSIYFAANGPDDASYSWEFEDGSPSTASGKNVTSVWSSTGTYIVTLTATRGNLTATATREVTIIDWTGVWGDTISYSNGAYYASESTATYYQPGIRIPKMHLVGRQSLDKVDVYIAENAIGSFTLNVYQGDIPNVENLVFNNTYEVSAGGQWHSFAIPDGLSLDTDKDLWIGIKYNGEAAKPFAVSDKIVDRNGYCGWFEDGCVFFSVYSDGTHPLMIRAITSGSAEPGAIDLTGDVRVGLYPNPTTGMVRIETAEPVEHTEVFNLAGSLLIDAGNASSIDLGSLAAGTYLLRITTANGIAIRHIVKQ